MHVRRSIILVTAALVIWTFVSFWIVAMTAGAHLCSGALLQTIPPGGFPGGVIPKLTQAEMDARIARCSAPRPGDFLIPAIGYILIVGFAVGAATGGKRDTSAET